MYFHGLHYRALLVNSTADHLYLLSSSHDHMSYILTDLCLLCIILWHYFWVRITYHDTLQTLSYNHTCSYLHTCLSVMAARYQKVLNTLDKVAMRQPSCTHIYTYTSVGAYTHVLSWPRAINLPYWTKCLWARLEAYIYIHLRLCTLSQYRSESST